MNDVIQSLNPVIAKLSGVLIPAVVLSFIYFLFRR